MSSVLHTTIADCVFDAAANGRFQSVLAVCRRYYDKTIKAASILFQSRCNDYERAHVKSITNQCHTHFKNMQQPECEDRSFQACEVLSCACAVSVSLSTGEPIGSGRSKWAFFNLQNEVVKEIQDAI
jgi:hypothetical protein